MHRNKLIACTSVIQPCFLLQLTGEAVLQATTKAFSGKRVSFIIYYKGLQSSCCPAVCLSTP